MSNQCPLPDQQELRIMLVGKTGVGKTSSMNTLLGRPGLTGTSASSQTTQCQIQTGEAGGQKLLVIDTPGLMNTKKTEEEVTRDVVGCVAAAAPGPHVFLLVLKPEVFSQQDKEVVEIIQEMFGKDSRKYTLALFTRGDQYKPTDQNVQKTHISQCTVGHHSFDNTGNTSSDQVRLLLEKINAMVQKDKHYTSDMLSRAQRVKEQQEERLKGEGVTAQALHTETVEAILSGVLGEPWSGILKAVVGLAMAKLKNYM